LEAEYILDRKKLLIVKASKLRNFGLPGAARANQFTDNKKSLALLISPLLETSSCSSHVQRATSDLLIRRIQESKKCEHNHEREAEGLQLISLLPPTELILTVHVSYILAARRSQARLNIILNFIDI
jgi:hypothetical protein